MTTGTFQASVDREFGKLMESQKKGTPGIDVMLTLIEGPDKGTAVKFTGWLTDSALERTAKNLASCFGWDGEVDRLYCGAGHHQRCLVVIGEKTLDNGNVVYEAKYINPLGSEMTDAKKKSLADSLREKMKAAVSGQSSPLAGKISEDLSSLDEIPF